MLDHPVSAPGDKRQTNRENSDATTIHVRRAKDGDSASLEWLATRFSPLLLAQARYRLRGSLAAVVQPEDLVNDVWAVALPAMPGLQAQHGRETPVLLKFLSTTLVYRCNELMRRQIRQRAQGGGPTDGSGLSEIPADTRGAFTRAEHHEDFSRLRRAIDELPDTDREVMVLRGIEMRSNKEAAEVLGQTPNAVSLRYNRVLEALRQRFAGSVLDELGS